MQVIRIYLDQPIIGGILGWIEDTTLLWMVAQIHSIKVSWLRLILGGLTGGFYVFLLKISQDTGGLVCPWMMSPLVIIIVPVLMMMVSFYPRELRKLLRLFGYIYFFSFLLAGFQWGLDTINQQFFQIEISLWWRFIIHLTLIFLMGELGWGVVHRQVWEHMCIYPIEICWENHYIKLNALLDTGNHLYDPLTKVPVVIIDLETIKTYLSAEVITFIEKLQKGDWEPQRKLPDFWIERVRLLPFHSLGQEAGMLVGFRPDRLTVWQKQQAKVIENVVIGLYQKRLSREGTFQALIPPTVIQP